MGEILTYFKAFHVDTSPSFFQMWDARKKGVINTFQSTYQVTAVSFNDTAEQIFSGGIDNDIKASDKYFKEIWFYQC